MNRSLVASLLTGLVLIGILYTVCQKKVLKRDTSPLKGRVRHVSDPTVVADTEPSIDELAAKINADLDQCDEHVDSMALSVDEMNEILTAARTHTAQDDAVPQVAETVKVTIYDLPPKASTETVDDVKNGSTPSPDDVTAAGIQ